jgi:4-amino-4-deoxy-L-arabinose transferase-like glycosyltransferase
LVLLAIALRIWLIRHTEVAARDSIGFIRTALELEKQRWTEVLRRSQQHPGYPVALMLVSWPVRQLLGGTTAVTMQLSAQLTSSLAGVLLVIPMFLLGCDLLDRRAAFWGTALFQCLPVCAHLLSDGLSEATYLLLITLALLCAVRSLRRGSVIGFALCGVCGGLAYLTRPEGALIVLATALVALGVQLVPAWRWPWRRTLACGGALLGAALLVASPYMFVIGGFTQKPTPLKMLESVWQEPKSASPPTKEISRRTVLPSSSQTPPALVASILGIYAPEELKDRRWWGLQAIGTEVIKDYLYILGIPVLLGMWWFRDRMRLVPGAWVLMTLCGLQILVLWRLALAVGYVSERHVLLLVLCGVFTGAAAVGRIGDGLARLIPSPRARWVPLAFLALMIGFALPQTFKPMHANRAGHRAAGEWLAANTIPVDPVVDPFCWAHYYAGRVFWEGKAPPLPVGHRVTQYVVLEQSDHDHYRLPTIKHAQDLAAQGTLVYHWPTTKPASQAKVAVYAVPGNP